MVNNISEGKNPLIEMNYSIIMGIIHRITTFPFVITAFLKASIKAKLIKAMRDYRTIHLQKKIF